MNPRPTLAALAQYYSEIPKDAGQLPAEALRQLPQPSPPAMRMIGQMLSLRHGPGRMLDVGAGGGDFSLAALRAGLCVTALEQDPLDLASLRQISGLETV